MPSMLLGFGQGHENFQLLAQIATKNLEYFGSFKERKVEDTKRVSEVVMLRRRTAVLQKSVHPGGNYCSNVNFCGCYKDSDHQSVSVHL